MIALSVNTLTGMILAAVPDAEATSLDTRGEGVVLTFEVDGAAYRLQLDPLARRSTDKKEETWTS